MQKKSTTTFEEQYPFTSRYLDIDGLKYHYLDEGSGTAVVMLHGNPTWSFYYRNLVLGLRHNHRVIVPDHMGCGFSDKPQNYSYRLKNHVSNLTRLLENLQIEAFSLIVHDWGGAIGLGYAVNHPQQLKKLVVFNTSPIMAKRFPLRILLCKTPILGAVAIRRFNFFAAAATRMACCNRRKMTKSVRDGYLRPYDSYANRIANLRFVQDIPLWRWHPSWKTASAIADKLDVLRGKPMLICWGDKDFCFTEFFLNQWRKRFPEAIVHRFPYAGHYVVEDAIDDILPLVQSFL